MAMTAVDDPTPQIHRAQLEDEALAIRAGRDFEAFAELYRRHMCRIYRFVRSQTPNDQTAEDVTAHVFFKALDGADSFRAEGSYRAWLFRIAHNTLSTWRSRRPSNLVTVGDVPDEPDPTPSPQSQVISGETRRLVWDTVGLLPRAQREVVALHYLEDFSIGEVAELTSRTKGAVRILLHRGRQKLRQVLEREMAT